MAWVVGVIAVLFLIAGISFFVSQAGVGVEDDLTVTQACPVEPYLDITVRNASVKSQTSGSATFEYGQSLLKKGSLTSGSSGTALRLGQTYDLLVSEGSHLNVIVRDIEVSNCGSNPMTIDMWRSDGGNISIYSSAGTLMTNAMSGGGTNQSSITSGTSRNMKVEISSLGDQALGVVWFTVEVFNKTQVQDIRLTAVSSGLTIDSTVRKALPSFASTGNSTATSYVEIFKVSGLANEGSVNTLTLTIEAHPSYSIDYSDVYFEAYSEQAFTDIDGMFTSGIEDSDGNAQYEDRFNNYTFHIT